jgi:hypothetical protein
MEEISMANKRVPSKIFPKVSTLPRQRTEAAHYLDMYKLTVEKKRIQQEINNINQRRQSLEARLLEIDQQLGSLSDGAEAIRQREDQDLNQESGRRPKSAAEPMPASNVYWPEPRLHQPPDDFSTVVLDY